MHTEFHHFMFSLLNQIIKGNNSIKSSIVTRTNTEHNKNSIHNIIRCIFRGKKRSRTFASMLLVAWLSSYMRQCPGKNRYSQRASTNAYSENTNSKVLCTESRPPTNYVTPNNHCRHVLFFRLFCYRWCCAICCSRRAHMKNAFEILCQITK